MKIINKIAITTVVILSIVFAVVSLFTLLRNSSYQYFKMLDFPRIQFFLISAFLFVLLLFFKIKCTYKKLLMSGLLISMVIHSYFLINYTPFVKVTVPDTLPSEKVHTKISILLSNVKMNNRDSHLLKANILEKNPDVILAMETDDWWENQLNYLSQKYPYSQRAINDKTYGMLLYSKFALENVQVDYLNNEYVPSFRGTLILNSSKKIKIHALHPVPPTSFKNLPDNFGQKEKSLQKLGLQIQNEKLPIILMGDLNDVVWSKIDHLTNTKNVLNDIRVGRGFYNTFDAEKIFLRWPLDHVFVSKEFTLTKIESLENIGSDHYPLYIELAL